MAMKKRVLFLLIGLCFSIASFAQVQVNGSVTDTQGEPVPVCRSILFYIHAFSFQEYNLLNFDRK